MTPHVLFVYGTLMRGERNHRLLAEAEFAGEARTAAGFTMIDLGEIALDDGGRAEAYLMPKRELRGNARIEGASWRAHAERRRARGRD